MSTLSWSIDLRPSTILHGAHLKYYVAIAAVLFIIWCFQPDHTKGPVDVPLFKAGKTKWMFQADKLIRESYNKFKDQCYQIKATEGIQVLIPPKMVNEIKSLPEDTLSATVAVREALMSKYTNFCPGPHGDLLGLLIRTRLGQNLSRLAPVLREELEFIVASEFPACEDWTSVKVQPFALRTVARLSGRAFVGPDICRLDEWMDVSINYAVHVFVAVVKLQFFPAWMRPVAKWLVKELRLIKDDVATARRLVEPLILERLKLMEEQDEDGGEGVVGGKTGKVRKHDDFAQWLLDGLPQHERGDVQTQTELQLILSAASIHTTNNLLTDCVLDLAAHPEMQDMLREEVMDVLGEDGGWDRKDAINRLKKMDSFIKETQRLAGNVTSFIRKVCKPITLSDGTYLPPGTNLLAPLAGVNHDPRFLGMMEESNNNNKATHPASSVSDSEQPDSETSSPTDSTLSESVTSSTFSESDSISISDSTTSETASIFDSISIKSTSTSTSTSSSSSSSLSPSSLPISSKPRVTPNLLDLERTPVASNFTIPTPPPPASILPTPPPASSPDTFDGLRYHKLRQRSSNDANRWQFTSLSDSNMNFGGGKHVCPGRFFAGCEIKTILAFFLSKYELRLVPNEERPKSMTIMMTRSPNPDGMVQFRKLKGV